MSTNGKVAVVTNATGFGGPGAVIGLLGSGFKVVAQDVTFSDDAAWDAFRNGRPGLNRLATTKPEEIIEAAKAVGGQLDALISNDHYPAPALPPETADPSELQNNLDRLVQAPFKLIQAALPQFEAQGGGNIVMITSNRTRLPLSGGAFADAARAAVNAMLRSLAVDLAPKNITVNAVAPNFLYSEAYYPKAVFERTKVGRDYISETVPAGRLADPAELGEVVAFLAGAQTRFLTGAILDFSGGWPAAAARPEP